MTGDIGTDPVRVTAISFVETADRRFLSRTIRLFRCTHLRFLPQPPFPQTVRSESAQHDTIPTATPRRSTHHPALRSTGFTPSPAGNQPYGGALHRQRAADQTVPGTHQPETACANPMHASKGYAHRSEASKNPSFLVGIPHTPANTRLQPDNRTIQRRRVPRITPPHRTSPLYRLTEQLHPPQVPKKPTHTLPQHICTRRSSRAHQPDQQPEHHLVVTVDDTLVRTDQHLVIGKPLAKLTQLP